MVKRKNVPDIQKQFRDELARAARENAKRQKEMDRLESEAGKLIAQANKANEAGKIAQARKYQERARTVLDELKALYAPS
jgi:hypothetical protein